MGLYDFQPGCHFAEEGTTAAHSLYLPVGGFHVEHGGGGLLVSVEPF